MDKQKKESVKPYTKHTLYISKHYASVHKKSVKTVQKLPKTSAKPPQNFHTSWKSYKKITHLPSILPEKFQKEKIKKTPATLYVHSYKKKIYKKHIPWMSVFYIVRLYFTLCVRILRCTSVFYVVRPYFTLYIRIDGKIYKKHIPLMSVLYVVLVHLYLSKNTKFYVHA